MSKIGLIVEGGGMKCAYSAGVLDAFLDHHITFDYCCGISAGSANVCSYMAGQRDRTRRFYTEHLKEPGYFGLKSLLKTGNLFGLDYIYSTLSDSDGADPLDYPALVANPAELCVVATDAESGKPAYFSKEDIHQDDYTVIKASCALPAVCKPIRYKGRYYYDGGVSDALPIRHAFRDAGCDKVVVLTSKNRDFIKEPEKHRFLYTLLCHRYPNTIRAINRRHIMYNKEQTLMYRLEEKGRIFIFAPSEKLKMGTYTMDPKIEQELYEMGLKDFHLLKERFMKFMNIKGAENESQRL